MFAGVNADVSKVKTVCTKVNVKFGQVVWLSTGHKANLLPAPRVGGCRRGNTAVKVLDSRPIKLQARQKGQREQCPAKKMNDGGRGEPWLSREV